MAAVAQRLAAVVMPCTLSFSAQMVPAPMKPIPATMPPATWAGWAPKLVDIMVKRHAPSDTSMCVRSPAGLCDFSRSMPTMAPNATARSRAKNVSRVSTVCITTKYAAAPIKTHLQTQPIRLTSRENRKRFTYAPPFTSKMPHDSQNHPRPNRQHPNGKDKPPQQEPKR
jgi:hypothetical protein